MKYVALLRGINVGGGNIIKMTDLKACLESAGFKNVVTYIASGNVIFEAPTADITALTTKVEALLSKQFGYQAKVVLYTLPQLERVVAEAPQGFGTEPTLYRYDVIFLKSPLTAAEALQNITAREGVDSIAAGTDVLFFSRLIARAAQSHLNKLILQPMYKNMTIRTWRTVTKLLALMK